MRLPAATQRRITEHQAQDKGVQTMRLLTRLPVPAATQQGVPEHHALHAQDKGS